MDFVFILQISELNFCSGIEELESLIGSTLSSDITLFEKISSSTYRVRINSSEMNVEESKLDAEDFGAVDDDLGDSGTRSNDDDSGFNSGNSKIKKLTYMNHGKSKDNMVIVYTEIDESHTREDPINATAECIPGCLHSASGAKIKRLSTKQHGMPRPTWVHAGHTSGAKEDYTLKFHPIDSSGSISKFSDERFSTKEREVRFDLHPMQSVFLGSDQDGHWEVIDTEEALCALLSVLDDRGKREALLFESVEKRCQVMSSRMVNSDRIDNLAQSVQSELDSVREDTYSPLSDVDNNFSGIANDSLPSYGVVALEVRKKGEQQKQKWSRIQAFDSWLWNSFYLDLNAVKHGKRSYFDTLTRCENCHDLYWRDEKHCRICHSTFELHFNTPSIAARLYYFL
ncbi:hypothetical protein CerSpe_103250 [Prunus speciosa]